MGLWDSLTSFFTGSPTKYEMVPSLLKEQMPLLQQYLASLQGQGAGGAFGDVADYYRSLLSMDPEIMKQFSAPMQRQFQQETIPGLAEQFAGAGAGGLSSSGFRNAGVMAGTDLAERLGALRAQLAQQGAAGLAGLAQGGLNNFGQSVMTQQGSPGLLANVAQGIGQAIPAFASGMTPFGGFNSMFGTKSPYGG